MQVDTSESMHSKQATAWLFNYKATRKSKDLAIEVNRPYKVCKQMPTLQLKSIRKQKQVVIFGFEVPFLKKKTEWHKPFYASLLAPIS